jgi:DNA polymerase-1
LGLKYDIDITNFHDLSWKAPNREILTNFITQYGFKSLVPRAEKLFGIDLEHETPNETKNIISKDITDISQLEEILKNARNGGFLAFFVDEHKRLNFAIDDKYQFIISDDLEKLPPQADLFALRPKNMDIDVFINVLADISIKKITFDVKKHMHFFYELKEKCEFTACEDLSLMYYANTAGLNQPNEKEFYTLNPITSFIEKYNEFLVELKENKALSLYYDIDLPISKILYKMERQGVKIDQAILGSMSKDFAREIQILESKIFTAAGTEFNVGSQSN